MSVLVTGAGGFIGSYLIPALVNKGYEVFATDLIAEPQWISDMDKVEYMRADLSREADVYKLMGVAKPEQVIHLVSLLAAPAKTTLDWGFGLISYPPRRSSMRA